jgi:hypothetical protein
MVVHDCFALFVISTRVGLWLDEVWVGRLNSRQPQNAKVRISHGFARKNSIIQWLVTRLGCQCCMELGFG